MKRLSHVSLRLALASTFVVLAPCSNVYDLCPPLESRRPFFSRGDCTVTRADIFAGHEYITLFANEELDEPIRFPDGEADMILDGNRRVDWPRELLVQLNVGIHAYVAAILEYTHEPELQADHFLLANRDTYAEAAASAHERLRGLTREAVDSWARERNRSLTLIGAGLHMIQDSHSEAHTVRDREAGCVIKIKAYIERDEGFLWDDIEFHGGTGDDEIIGHSSPDDSVFNGTDECRNPEGAQAVRECFRESAEDAVTASRDYLEMVVRLAEAGPWDDAADRAVDAYIADNLTLCEE